MAESAIAQAKPRRSRRKPDSLGLQLPLAPSLEQRRLRIYLLLLATDGLAIFSGFAFAAFLYFGHWTAQVALLEAQLILPLFWTIAIANGAYSAGRFDRRDGERGSRGMAGRSSDRRRWIAVLERRNASGVGDRDRARPVRPLPVAQ